MFHENSDYGFGKGKGYTGFKDIALGDGPTLDQLNSDSSDSDSNSGLTTTFLNTGHRNSDFSDENMRKELGLLVFKDRFNDKQNIKHNEVTPSDNSRFSKADLSIVEFSSRKEEPKKMNKSLLRLRNVFMNTNDCNRSKSRSRQVSKGNNSKGSSKNYF